jgi:hypothetical protein
MKSNVKTFLEQLKTSYAGYLLDNGKLLKGRLDTKTVPDLADWVKRKKPKTRQCYYNAQKFILDNGDDEYTYHEGYWLWHGGPFPVHHGWLVNKAGEVVDFTAEACDKVLQRWNRNPAKDEYVGIAVPYDFILKKLVENETWDMLSPDYSLERAIA